MPMQKATIQSQPAPRRALRPAFEAPFISAPESARTVFLVTLAAACRPLAAGLIFFGYRAAVVAAVCVVSCAAIERLYYRVTRTPALLGRTHAYLTGLLLALTLPPFVPWYIAVIASAFAIIVGKAIFGGVGHFVWQPALVGRLAVAVMFPVTMNPADWPLLGGRHLLTGDINRVRTIEDYRSWRRAAAPGGADGFRLSPPRAILAKLTRPPEGAAGQPLPPFSSLAEPRVPQPGRAGERPAVGAATPWWEKALDGLFGVEPGWSKRRLEPFPGSSPAALRAPPPDRLPPINELLIGARPGGIGETCAVVIVVAGLYLVYRNYVRWQLPVAFIAAAWCVAAVAPIKLAGPNGTIETVYVPLLIEGFDVGFTYVNYQILSGEMLLAAVFLATEMTSRPVTTGGQVLFGTGCGVLAMIMQLYLNVPIPSYMAVVAMNTLTPAIDSLWRPRPFGRRHFERLRGVRP